MVQGVFKEGGVPEGILNRCCWGTRKGLMREQQSFGQGEIMDQTEKLLEEVFELALFNDMTYRG